MNKLSFLLSLRDRLSELPQEDVEERLRFYSEMIEDRVEEGVSEEDAVSAVGSVEEIAAQIAADIPHSVTESKKPKFGKRLTSWEILLLVLGSPVWLSLLIAAGAVILSLWVVIWAVVIALWAVFASVAACAAAGVAVGICFALSGNTYAGIAMIAAEAICAGLGILLFYGCRATTEGAAWLTKKTALGLKKCFVHREEV